MHLCVPCIQETSYIIMGQILSVSPLQADQEGQNVKFNMGAVHQVTPANAKGILQHHPRDHQSVLMLTRVRVNVQTEGKYAELLKRYSDLESSHAELRGSHDRIQERTIDLAAEVESRGQRIQVLEATDRIREVPVGVEEVIPSNRKM